VADAEEVAACCAASGTAATLANAASIQGIMILLLII
jgi:hypothetical protein